MGARIFTGAVHPHHTRQSGVPFTNEPRVVIHWDGVANRKQHEDLGDGVVWVNTAEMMRPGVNLGLNIFAQCGVTEISIAGSLSPGRLVQQIEKNDDYGGTIITAEDPNFESVDTIPTGEILQVTKLFSILKIAFAVDEPATLQLTAY